MKTKLLGILSSGPSCLARFGLDVEVDQEESGEEGSQKDGKVGSELNFEGESLGGEGLDDRVHGECGG